MKSLALFSELICWICKKKKNSYPLAVLIQALKEVFHPVSERFESGRGKFAPNIGNLSVKQRTRNFIKLAAHSHFTSQGLGKNGTKSVCSKKTP